MRAMPECRWFTRASASRQEIVDAARKEKAHVIGLSVLSGSHLPLVEDVVERMKRAGLDVPVIVGGIIPPEDAADREGWRCGGLHAEGFRAEPHHVRRRADR